MMARAYFRFEQALRRAFRSAPLCWSLCLYLLLSFLPAAVNTTPAGVLVLRCLLPGVLAVYLSLRIVGVSREVFHLRGFGKSLAWASPAAVFCLLNVVLAPCASFSGERALLLGGLALTEELTARVFLLSGLELVFQHHSRKTVIAAVLSALIFGLAHLSNWQEAGSAALLQCVYTTVLGAVFAVARWRSERISGCVFWHVLLNISAVWGS